MTVTDRSWVFPVMTGKVPYFFSVSLMGRKRTTTWMADPSLPMGWGGMVSMLLLLMLPPLLGLQSAMVGVVCARADFGFCRWRVGKIRN